MALSRMAADSLEGGVSLTEAQRVELERRWRAFEQNPDEGEPWEDVKRSLLSE